MKSKSELVVTGTVGGSVDISCKYADKYKYTPMYFCRNRCTSSDVLIESKRADMVVSKGRYTAVNTVTASRFSVIIRRLTLKDSGVYYCGVEKWGYDKFTKVKLTVKGKGIHDCKVQLLNTSTNMYERIVNFSHKCLFLSV